MVHRSVEQQIHASLVLSLKSIKIDNEETERATDPHRPRGQPAGPRVKGVTVAWTRRHLSRWETAPESAEPGPLLAVLPGARCSGWVGLSEKERLQGLGSQRARKAGLGTAAVLGVEFSFSKQPAAQQGQGGDGCDSHL